MANEYRFPSDYKFGTLTTAAAISDTSLASAEFAALATGYSTALYMPIVLHDPSVGYEVMWMTAHTASSTSITVVRAKEGTTARAWPSSTQWLVAPTVRDALNVVFTSGGLPSDAHVGARAVQTDTGDVWDKTKNQGWQSWPASKAADVASSGTPVPAGSRPIFKAAGYPSTNTNGSGQITFTLPGGGFPTAAYGAIVQIVSGTGGNILSARLDNLTTTTAMFTFFSGTTAVATTAVVAHVIAFGY